ncbi:acyl-protein thioesterase 1-like, partial [Trifolium medium]|nr:acyl-protein thioesterase 1-like [Trifolium medium]
DSPNDESSLLKAVQNVHATIDKEIAAGTNPNNVFVCGFSQGGALTLASVLLYPKTLGGGAVFSGWVPFNSSITEQITPEAKQLSRNPFSLIASASTVYVDIYSLALSLFFE